MSIPLLIGLGAGLVSALLFASASGGTLLGLLVLFFLTPLPVAICGLGWGWRSAAAAAVAAPVMVAVLVAPRAAMFHAVTLGAPTVVLSYLSLLSRPAVGGDADSDAKLEWYPVGRIVAIASVWAGTLAALALLTTATDMEALRTVLRQTFERVILQQLAPAAPGGQILGEKEIAGFTELMVVSFAGAVATLWMGLATFNLWLAALVTHASGRLVRPWPDLAALNLPRAMPFAFAAAIVLTFLPGLAGLVATGFASAFLFAYLLVGLAILHHMTRGMGMRGFILGAVYASLLLFNPFSGLAVATIGLAEPISPLRRKPPPPH